MSDFRDERKDCEKAQGALEEFRVEKKEQDKMVQEEIASLQKQIRVMEQEHAKSIGASGVLIESLRKQIMKISHERDDFMNEVDRRKTSKHHKIKDYDRMKEQVRVISNKPDKPVVSMEIRATKIVKPVYCQLPRAQRLFHRITLCS